MSDKEGLRRLVQDMSIDPSDVTIIFQGGISVEFDIRYVADFTRRVFPGATIILATQTSEVDKLNSRHGFDEIVATPDPGGLPPVKFEGAPHNVNRQIASSYSGLEAVNTPFAMKVRTDAFLSSQRIFDYWSAWQGAKAGPTSVGQDRILTVSFFTVNPRYDERVPYHVSDWLQFGRTDDLRRFWSCPRYERETGTWYETRPHEPGSLKREREFRSRYSTEQWLTMNYIADPTTFIMKYHNHCTPEILSHYEEVLVDNFIITHPLDIDLFMPKHRWVFRSTYFNTLCYSYLDWAEIMRAKRGLVRQLSGYSQWPRTQAEKRFYMAMRTSAHTQWIKKLPGSIGRFFDKRFFAWD